MKFFFASFTLIILTGLLFGCVSHPNVYGPSDHVNQQKSTFNQPANYTAQNNAGKMLNPLVGP